MSTETAHWKRTGSWPCPYPWHGHSFDSIEQLQIHVSQMEADAQRRHDWEASLGQQLLLDLESARR